MRYAEWKHGAKKFNARLRELSKVFAVPDEMVFEDREPELKMLEIMNLADETGFGVRAAKLNGRTVENLLFHLIKRPRSEKSGHYEKILKSRMSKRIVSLIWAFFAQEYTNENMAVAMKLAADYIERTGHAPPYLNIIREAGSKNPAALVAREITAGGSFINGFLNSHEISRESPLAAAAAALFLAGCGREGYFLNESWMLRLIRSGGPDIAILSNYLGVLPESEYIEAVNECLLERYGLPSAYGDWPGLPDALRTKFLRWYYLRQMRGHFGNNRKKYDCYVKYLPYFKNIGANAETGTLTIDFGDYFVTDDNPGSDYSFMNDKYTHNANRGELPYAEKKLPEARDFIIKDTADGTIRLNFHDVGRLYVTEAIEIRLGIMPDTRASSSIIASKSRRVIYGI